MGGTCSKIVSVKTSKAFNNRIHSLPLPQEEKEKVEGNSDKPKVEELQDKNLDRVTIENQTVELEPPESFSKGDHNRDKLIEVSNIRAEQYTLTQNNKFARGDYKIEELSKDCYTMIEVEENSKLQGAAPNGDENQNTTPQVCENTDSDKSKDSNDNSYNRHINGTEVKYNIDIDSNSDETEDNVPLAPRDKVKMEDNEQEEKQDCQNDVNAIPQDSLFFLPLDGDQQRPPATYKIPERLNRSRKPPLSYSERMLLADCNRFQQLDKKREFAVRRNRSISRMGKLPKISDAKGENPEVNSKVSFDLDKPDL